MFPVLQTKLHSLLLRSGLTPRPELTARLNQNADKRLILLSTAPGFGKTTLLSS